MEKFKIVRPDRPVTKSQFSFQMDDDLQVWIRTLAIEHEITIGDAMHQALRFAHRHVSRR